jgi:uncharacterized membrane protein YsdA (DUF1294 family)
MPRRRSRHPSPIANTTFVFLLVTLLVGLLLFFLAYQVQPWHLHVYLVWLVTWNVMTLLLYVFDKGQSRQRGRALRVPEVVLLILTGIGGVAGAWIGMLRARHKTRHSLFWIVLALSTVVHVVLVIFLLL